MNPYKNISILIILIALITSCSSAQKLQDNAPINNGEVYYQKWVAGVKGGGSGINLFIPLLKELPDNIQLDSVYFRGLGTHLESTQNDKMLYVGRFKTGFNQKNDIIMSSDVNEEYGNSLPIEHKRNIFKLKENECIISYQSGNQTYYYKIENITQKPNQNYPSAPLNN